ncbi:hypothetical protein ACVWWO_002259 [Bradyrhizobium sp. F1.13.1]
MSHRSETAFERVTLPRLQLWKEEGRAPRDDDRL